MSDDSDSGGFGEHAARAMVRRARHHGGICTARQLPLSIPGCYDSTHSVVADPTTINYSYKHLFK